ncbi:Uncharacterised protein [Legionella beliardensis]|uniref:Transmembrane protein n=1 Tax=Legionella beliardensis TaxID=91822 RepID=A0A378I0J2_9GAMM|nr:hypothetical protein [Legionella beliardensis]STX28513.1 Uncharacterised protein [Legionella beliardensis]
MIWTLFALFFWWLIYRELKGPLLHFFGFKRNVAMPVFKGYLVLLFVLALLCSWPPLHRWYFQRFLTDIARQLSQNPTAIVHCNTLFDTLFDEDVGVGGHADINKGFIVIQYPRCKLLADYIRHPEQATREELISLNILTHESMHVRGEYDEAKTECQAVQRNFLTAKLLGVPALIAKENALNYYVHIYLKRRDSYFSKDCAAGKALDEHLPDSIWPEQ